MSDAVRCESASIAVDLRTRALAYVALTKPRIGILVLVTTAVGFYLARPASFDFASTILLTHALLGVGLVAAGANGLNQFLEVDFDRLMVRTADRPLPTGVISRAEALAFSMGISTTGTLYLIFSVNLLTAALTASTIAIYALVYTPMKRMTPLSVHVGAVAGALPPMIGWTAGSGALSLEAWALFAILYFWQLPHFAAISWQYREDYARAGYPMLSVVDRDGTRLGPHMTHHTLGLIIASLFPTALRISGAAYAVTAMVLGVLFLISGIRFLRSRTAINARRHVVASIIYLPLLLLALLLDKFPR